MKDREIIAALALRAAIRFSAETVQVCDMNPKLVSNLNKTATIANLERDIEAMQAFVNVLKGVNFYTVRKGVKE